jgi:hypothetical protein
VSRKCTAAARPSWGSSSSSASDSSASFLFADFGLKVVLTCVADVAVLSSFVILAFGLFSKFPFIAAKVTPFFCGVCFLSRASESCNVS